MRGYVIRCGLFCVLLTATVSTTALPRRPRPPFFPCIEPYVCIEVKTRHVDLGVVPQPGVYDSPATVTVHVVANCNHSLVAQAKPLRPHRHTKGGSIPLERFLVKTEATGGFVPLTGPVSVTGSLTPGARDINLQFRVITEPTDEAGQYKGIIVFTCGSCP